MYSRIQRSCRNGTAGDTGVGGCRTTRKGIGMAQSVRAQTRSITERVLKDPTDENIERAIEDLKKMSAAATDPQDMVAAD